MSARMASLAWNSVHTQFLVVFSAEDCGKFDKIWLWSVGARFLSALRQYKLKIDEQVFLKVKFKKK